MNNQYSRGCGYNYRRSAQREMNLSRSASAGMRSQEPEMGCSVCRIAQSRDEDNCCMENHSMENHSMENRSMENHCMENRSMENCSREQWSMGKSLAMGYVPMQVWSQPLAPCKGMQIGTIFSDLHKPFCGKGGACR